MTRDLWRFPYDEATLIHILQWSMDHWLTFQISNDPRFGESVDPERQKRLDEGREVANKLLHLDIAEGMGLMKAIGHSTKRNPTVKDINDEPVCVSTYRITYRGMRYLQSPVWLRWIVRNSHEITPVMAIFGFVVAYLSLALPLWLQG